MTLARCPRLFEVEAMRDGRLAGPELAAFGRHMTTCRACAREAKALDTLAEGVRTGAIGEEPVDQLRIARERTRLLADFDSSLVASGRGRSGRPLVWSAAALALAVGLFLASRTRPSAPLATGSSVLVRPEGDASWSKRPDGDGERIVLDRGALTIHVDHSAARHGRLVVMLPDGELEDIGTTFTVSAAHGHTERVAVQEGSVLLRLRGRAPVALSAGQTWSADAASTAAVVPIAPPPSAVAKSEPRHPDKAPLARPNTSVTPDEAPQSIQFRAVVRALDSGDACEAASGFGKFVTSYANNPRAEDAAYLRVIALQRCGSDDVMRRAAREYLGRYPAGFRRAEVERLSR